MDRAGKIFLALFLSFGIMLTICLVLSIASVALLSESREESAIAAEQNEQRLKEIYARLDQIEHTNAQGKAEEDSSIEVNADQSTKADGFLIRELDGEIGIYSKDGALLKKVAIPLQILPHPVRQGIQNGMEIDSREELLRFFQDIGS